MLFRSGFDFVIDNLHLGPAPGIKRITNYLVALNDLSTTDLTDALDVAVPEAPTANALTDTLHKDGSFTYDNTTDSLEAIADVGIDNQYGVDVLPKDVDSIFTPI